MKSRILVSVVGVPILLYVVLFAPSPVLLVALSILAGIAGLELQQCVSGEKRSEWIGICAGYPVFTVVWYYDRPEQVGVVFFLGVVVFFAIAVCKGGAIKFQQVMAALFGTIVIGYSFASFIRMDAAGLPRAYLLLPFVLSFMSDTGGFFGGKFFGKHKLAPKVSPKKTVEGSIGGLVGNVLGGLLFVFVLERWFGGSVVGYGAMVMLALSCSAVAQLGDLSFSLIKREFGIKDYGRLFLAHGGVLDRFDSVLFVAPLIEIVLRFIG